MLKPLLQIDQNLQGISLSQSKYTVDLIKKFGFTNSQPYSTPIAQNQKLTADPTGKPVDQKLYRAMIGSLMYLTASRPDIMFPTCLCARFQADPKESHMKAVKRIFRYLKGTPNLGLWYPNNSSFDLLAFSDSDHAGCFLDRKSTSGGCQFLGNRLIAWQCKKQQTVSLSSTEAEYIACGSCCAQVLWIQNQLRDFNIITTHTNIQVDNTSTIAIACNPVHHSRTKHIDIRYHFLRDHVEQGRIVLKYVNTDNNLADLFTKAFDSKRFLYLCDAIGMTNFPSLQ